ncbi:aldo/keto reductase [Candidimonas sp. SYP-B2681]|uniref:aldo/keto reductase n=1 Tax=Candidimonas sp. SYP-B2681 TaxID=2497686 RepID=UPI0018F58474|nr:aldo/keto reductase [Candidimonas sp. SYP-B2681]
MQKRTLGQSGVEIAPIVFGGNVFGWTADEARSFELLDRFVEQGFNAVDTADVYSAWVPENTGGESENVIGRWLAKRKRRDDIVLMTKVGMLQSRKGLSAQNIDAALNDSLKRLQTDYVDVYFAHIDDKDVALDETLEALHRAVKAGKVRTMGASNYDPDRIRQALQVSSDKNLPRYEVMQPEYNLYDRHDFESGTGQVALENGLGVVTYFSLASGFLTGKYESKADAARAARAGMLEKYFDERGMRILKALRDVAKEHNATQAQVALAWLIAKPAVTAAIASATKLEQLEDIMGAASLKLSAEAMSTLENASR